MPSRTDIRRLMPEYEVVRDDDPRLGRLEERGYIVVGRSWGARLQVDARFEASTYRALVARAEAAGYRVLELDESWVDALFELESETAADYPITPATPAPVVTRASTTQLWADGWRVFGAVRGEVLVGATLVKQAGDHAETERTSVHADHRERGVAAALKAASILALAADGVRTFGTGGAQANAASLAMNRVTGYEITETWLSLAPPR